MQTMTLTAQLIKDRIENQSKTVNKADKASVFIPIIKNSHDQLSLLFQIRSSLLTWQPGDICFPGGRMETQDCSPIDTAIRETHEELGIAKEMIQVYGQLPAFISAIGLKIYPIVGELSSLQFNLNKNEVADTFTVPIDWFIANHPVKATIEVAHKPANDFPFELVPQRSKDWKKRSQHPVYFYHYQKYVIWGLTAQIVQLFLTTIR